MNSTAPPELPPLPDYELRPLPSLLSWFPDPYLATALPVIAYWVVSLFFHIIDIYDLFPQYRLHTPAEIIQRNHVSRWEVFRDVLVQQVIQMAAGFSLTVIDPPQMVGQEEYDVHVWARRIRLAEQAVPTLLAMLGFDASAMADKLSSQRPSLAGVLRGGHYSGLLATADFNGFTMSTPAFAQWELQLASVIYWWAVPAMQLAAAVCILDTWQYFWHRAMHLNKFLYTNFHYRHHRLYVPYAYGALYNHPVEGFILDTAGAGVAYLLTGMTIRQSMIFFSLSTIKTVDDHCGYSFPWDPLQLISDNNAGYHDVHHQSWGIKTNFSQPYFTVWDRIMGTKWTGGDVSARYARSRKAAEAKMSRVEKQPITASTPADSKRADSDSEPDPITAMYAELSPSAPAGRATKQAAASRRQVLDDQKGGGYSVLLEEAAEEEKESRSLRRSPRKKSSSSTAEGSLKNLSEKVSGGLHSGVGSVLKGADH